MLKVKTGLEVFLDGKLKALEGARVGLLSHQASVDSHLRPILPLLHARGIHITALFGPEHGLWGTAQDQVPIQDAPHPGASLVPLPSGEGAASRVRQLPLYSLYGDHRAPTAEQLRDVDILICDLQDVGSRYYTFVWTMALAMQV